jgi:outer membrane immunogenic protein
LGQKRFVAGFEGDIDWSGMLFTQSATTTDFFGTSSATLTYKDDILSTFAARFGYAADRALFYAKAGGVWTQEKFDLSGTDPVFGTISGSDSFSRLGWMVEAGVEYAVTNNITLKAEYNFLAFGTENETLTADFSSVGPLTANISSNSR